MRPVHLDIKEGCENSICHLMSRMNLLLSQSESIRDMVHLDSPHLCFLPEGSIGALGRPRSKEGPKIISSGFGG